MLTKGLCFPWEGAASAALRGVCLWKLLPPAIRHVLQDVMLGCRSGSAAPINLPGVRAYSGSVGMM